MGENIMHIGIIMNRAKAPYSVTTGYMVMTKKEHAIELN